MKNRYNEAICAITRNDALYCIATSANGVHAEVACPAGDGRFLPSIPMARSTFDALLTEAGDLVCICNDAPLPGYAVAFYDRKYDLWTRFKTNPKRVAVVLAKYETQRNGGI